MLSRALIKQLASLLRYRLHSNIGCNETLNELYHCCHSNFDCSSNCLHSSIVCSSDCLHCSIDFSSDCLHCSIDCSALSMAYKIALDLRKMIATKFEFQFRVFLSPKYRQITFWSRLVRIFTPIKIGIESFFGFFHFFLCFQSF